MRIRRFLAWPHRLFFGVAYGVLGVSSALAGLAIASGKLSPSDVRESRGVGLLLWIGFLGMHAYYAFSDRQQDDGVHRIITQAFESE